jgi:hypothetical protein
MESTVDTRTDAPLPPRGGEIVGESHSDLRAGEPRGYQRPEIQSYTSRELLEILGPARGYENAGGDGSGIGSGFSTLGVRKS